VKPPGYEGPKPRPRAARHEESHPLSQTASDSFKWSCLEFIHTVDGSDIPGPTTWDAKNHSKERDKLPTSTGFHAGFQPSTVKTNLEKLNSINSTNLTRKKLTTLP